MTSGKRAFILNALVDMDYNHLKYLTFSAENSDQQERLEAMCECIQVCYPLRTI